jgi:hypothetical protein
VDTTAGTEPAEPAVFVDIELPSDVRRAELWERNRRLIELPGRIDVEPGARRELEVRAAGYKTARIAVTSDTPSPLRVALEENVVRGRKPRARNRNASPRPEPPAPPPVAPEKKTTTKPVKQFDDW